MTNVGAKLLTVMVDVLDMNGGTAKHFGFTVAPLETRAALLRRSRLKDHG